MLSRRHFLLGFLAAVALAPLPSRAAEICVTPDKSLSLRRGDQLVEVAYLHDGQLDLEAYNRVCWVLRDVAAGKQAQIDPQLLDFPQSVQTHARLNGNSEPLEILSGYRTPATNKRIAGARHSFHLVGNAVDFRLPGLSALQLGQVASQLGAGRGVYPGHYFVHIDTGWERA